MEPFVHLHVHSQYSILDGQASIKGLVDKAIADGMPALALTDHEAMFGIKEFYNYVNSKNKDVLKDEAKELEQLKKLETRSPQEETRLAELEAIMADRPNRLLKPIIGCEVYCARRHRTSKEPASTAPDTYRPNRSIDQSGWHLVLLAKNLQGYKNLIKIVSLSFTEGYYYRARIDKELLEKYHEGLIVTTACLGGEVPQHILHDQIDRAEESILWFKRVFADDFYLELQRHKATNPNANQETYPQQEKVNRILLELGKKHNIKVIATNDVHFINEHDAEAHERLVCISTGKRLSDMNRGMSYSKQEWLKTTEEMNAVFADLPDVLRNTLEIAGKVETYSIDNAPLMPDFPIPEGFDTADDYLKHLTYQGAKRKYADRLTPDVQERIDFELDTIKRMGFPGYFLIVQDFIRAARDMGIFVGPGRGSAAGSAVAYCLDIVDIDPIRYDLLFERFLNPDRISMPDIDIDFDDDGRADILQWVTDKYGKERVAHIATYGTMASKSSIKDVARIYDLPIPESNRLAALIPDKIEGVKKVTIREAVKHIQDLQIAALSSNPQISETIRYAQELEGNVRNRGVHACGIIIGKTDINEVVPLCTAVDKSTGKEILVTQYEGSIIEETGLIKMDFLGLKTLSILREAVDNIRKRQGIEVDINKIPIDDAKTYELYAQGKTVGTFQFESAGMQKYLRELQPTVFEDLIAMNALYRPGPMEYIPDFVARKHGRTPITYDLPCMERYLKDTYGITVYQEQVMLLSREIAGFTRGESDNLRKAMGKKLADKMAALKIKFLEGGRANGYDTTVLEKIWADWAKFASYAFNKSHATAYSWVAYQTAYLKANYPSEYMAGALSRVLDNITEITKLMDESRSMGIKVLVPDVNESELKFSVNKGGDIRFGLNAIKGVGRAASEHIVEERERAGLYQDIYDFFERINLSTCNRKTLESLVDAGGLDSFGIEREVYWTPMPTGRAEDTFLNALIRYGAVYQEDKHSSANSLFGADDEAMSIPRPTPPMLSDSPNHLERLTKEKNLVGVYLSSNPLEPYRAALELYCNMDSLTFTEGRDSFQDGQKIIIAGFVSQVSRGMTKKGDPMGRIYITDMRGTCNFALFGDSYLENARYFHEGLLVLVHASVQPFNRFSPDNLTVRVERISLLNDVLPTLFSEAQITMPASHISIESVEALVAILENNTGQAMLSLKVVDQTTGHAVQLQYDIHGIEITPRLLDYCYERGYSILAH